jgi:hypothetical protein
MDQRVADMSQFPSVRIVHREGMTIEILRNSSLQYRTMRNYGYMLEYLCIMRYYVRAGALGASKLSPEENHLCLSDLKLLSCGWRATSTAM